MSIFSKTNNYVKKPKRNTFDLSFQNNLTAKFGALYPIMCKEVIPGDSFRIKPTFALKFMPMYFPVQTRMKAYLHFFYVRNRNLWKDWMDFIGKTKTDLDFPYIDFKGEIPATGSLSDYLGLPTVRYSGTDDDDGDVYGGEVQGTIQYSAGYVVDSDGRVSVWILPISGDFNSDLDSFQNLFSGDWQSNIRQDGYLYDADGPFFVCLYFLERLDLTYTESVKVTIPYHTVTCDFSSSSFTVPIVGSISFYSSVVFARTNRLLLFDESYNFIGCIVTSVVDSDNNVIFDFADAQFVDGKSYSDVYRCIAANFYSSSVSSSSSGLKAVLVSVPDGKDTDVVTYSGVSIESTGDTSGYGDIDRTTSPFYDSSITQDDNVSQLKISALPFRAYESIYNAFFRNPQNNPFVVDGVEEYNKYIPSKEGGAESIDHFPLRYRNWESDFLTSALPSPQQGTAPLVGITATGAMTFADEDGNTYSAQATFSDDGNTITGFKVTSATMPQGNLRALVDMATSGIGINDLRNVNSLQRWLETNIRRGYKYKDQLLSHYGVNASFDELDMPEFIGGCSQDIMVNQISQTSESNETPLGFYGGQASAIGTCHSVTKYCDEHGFIMGIMSIVPVPNYSQLLPKFYLKNLTLDYFFPEFGHIGMQPIKYDELCPVQSYNASKANAADEMQTVFGYQRAWYDYLASVDEVHGDFRTSLRNYLINRVFKNAPELGTEFLLVDPDQVNDVFNYTEDTDKILGQVYLDIKAKRPIPMFGIPRIE